MSKSLYDLFAGVFFTQFFFKYIVDNCLIISKTEECYKGDDGYVFDVRNSTKGKYGTRKVFLTPRAAKIVKMIMELNPDGKCSQEPS